MIRKEYNKNKQPNEDDLERMSQRTKLPVDCVTSWFEKKRSKNEKTKRAFAHTDYLNKKYNENKYPSKQHGLGQSKKHQAHCSSPIIVLVKNGLSQKRNMPC